VPESSRRLSAIMFTDMVGYAALAQANEAAALTLLDQHNQLLRPIFAQHRGREVKTVGDAFLVEFRSALDAVTCALEVQRTLRAREKPAGAEENVQIRIGIHVGDVVESDGDVLGDAVNIASRIEPLAEPGGICISQQVYDQVLNKVETPLVRLPPVALKNIRVPMTLYRVVPPWSTTGPVKSPAVAGGERSLAVLPLVNISPDPSDEYFADGLTEELITVLSQVRDLSVIARTSVAQYKSASKPIAQVGAELGVDTVLEGSVRKAGNRIRITLQLVDVGTQRHIWASSYNRVVDDVFAVQSDIADRTAEALRLQLGAGGGSDAKTRAIVNPDAYDLYLKGLVASRHVHLGVLDEAARCFEAATKLDPTFAEAFAAWANLYVVASADVVPLREVVPKARELAARAIELDSKCSEAHSSLGNIALQFDHDWDRAEREFLRAIELNPSNVTAHTFYGLLLVALERFDEAIDEFRRTVRLDPGGSHQRSLAWAHMEAGNWAEGIRAMEEQRDRNPGSVSTHTYLGLCYLQAGRREEALREAGFPTQEASFDERFDHALLDAMLGRPAKAREIIAEVERGETKVYLSAAYYAMLYAVLDERSKALDLLEKDCREGDNVLWLYYRGLFFDSIRDDPRFIAMLRQFGLPTHGREAAGKGPT